MMSTVLPSGVRLAIRYVVHLRMVRAYVRDMKQQPAKARCAARLRRAAHVQRTAVETATLRVSGAQLMVLVLRKGKRQRTICSECSRVLTELRWARCVREDEYNINNIHIRHSKWAQQCRKGRRRAI